MTITEALAEMKTLAKRIEKKREAITPYLLRQSIVVDPFTDSGGSREFVRRERQALDDMERRMVAIRTSIQKTNQATPITVEGETKTIAEWLTWRKEVAPGRQKFLQQIRATILRVRDDMQKKGGVVGEAPKADSDKNITVNVDEAAVIKEIEQMENILGTLDGQLSLKNATVMVQV
jgi:hypothetical protein